MPRRTRQSKSSARNRVDSSSSDSSSNSDSDNSLELKTASDVINSFLHTSKTVQQVVNTPKSRKASDVINSFLRKTKIVSQASQSQFESALDVINSYLRKDNFEEDGESVEVPPERTKEISCVSTPVSEVVSTKRRRRVTSGLESDSQANKNVAKKRRVEDESSIVETKVEPVFAPKVEPIETVVRVPSPGRMVWIPTNETPDNSTSNNNDGPLDIQAMVDENIQQTGNNNRDVAASPEEGQSNTTVSATRKTLNANSETNSAKKNGSAKDTNKTNANVKPSRKPPVILTMSFTREVFNRKTNTKRMVEQQATVRECPIPKEKYDRALAMLNATECRYDETPVDYNLPKPTVDIRHSCNGRRHAEATYDTDKLNTSLPYSLTRIVFELDNCLRRENWSQMAELIYYGCGLLKTEQARRAIGTTFFTYALLLLLLDSSTNSIATLNGKRNEVLKFLIALGSEPEESQEFLKELHFVMDGNDTANGFLTIKSEEE